MRDFDKLHNIASLAKSELMANGADKALVKAACSVKNELNVECGVFTLMRTVEDDSLSLSAIADGRKGKIAINNFDEKAISAAAADTMAVAQASEPDSAWVFAENPGEEKVFCEGVFVSDNEKMFERTKELLDLITKEHPLLTVNMVTSHNFTRSVMLGSDGLLYKNEVGYYDFDINFVGKEGEDTSSFCGTNFSVANLDTPFIEMSNVRQSLIECEEQIHTKALPESFCGTMLLTPECLTEFAYYLIENYCSDQSVMENSSPWLTKLGEKLADEKLQLSLCPRSDFAVGAAKYDAEGYLAENFDVIKDGVFENFCISDYVARKKGMKRAGNKSFNFYIKPGETALSDIISGIEKGVLVGRFSGGAPSSNGDFSGVAKNSFLIENGKKTKALREVMINGNLSKIFANIANISKETYNDGSVSVPWASFDGITISGK
ncbi:MAG: TldD/PmbA family protein [Ruminococcaceae bacterium]|nr:TldD/PmbA family protein [Oscillospiraceae bacterium]